MYGWLIDNVWVILLLIGLAVAGWFFLINRVRQNDPKAAEDLKNEYRKLFKLPK